MTAELDHGGVLLRRRSFTAEFVTAEFFTAEFFTAEFVTAEFVTAEFFTAEFFTAEWGGRSGGACEARGIPPPLRRDRSAVTAPP